MFVLPYLWNDRQFGYIQRKETLEETRSIRARQDLEYEESLRIDKSKDEQARKERSKAEVS